MNFLYPVFLFALFAVIIPILIHLFSFRRFTTVYFSNVNYLKNIRKESQKKSRLKNLLILASRILAVSSLVVAFAQPFIPAGHKPASQLKAVVGIYIDNSFSMNALSTGGQLLEVARTKAIDIAGAYPPDTRFMVITNDLLPQHQHVFNKEQFIRQVSEIKSSPRSLPLSRIVARLSGNLSKLDDHPAMTAWYLSDFQTVTTDLEHIRNDSLMLNYLMPLTPGVTANLFIDSCWMEFPAHKQGQEERLKVRITNRSEEAYQNLPLKFYLNDTLKALGNFTIDPGGEQVVELKYMNMNSGVQTGYAEISDFPFVHDNTWFLNYRVQPSLKALAVYDGGYGGKSGVPYLRALFREDEYVQFEEASLENLQFSRLSSFNTIFLLNIKTLSSGFIHELKKAAENGATVVLFPELDGETATYNNFLNLMQANRITGIDTSRQKIAAIEWNNPVYDQVFKGRIDNAEFPAVNGHFSFTEDVRIPETRLIWFRNNAKAVSVQGTGDGNLIVFSFPLSTLNQEFARDMLFVPTLYSLVINSLPRQRIAYSIGENSVATLSRQNIPDGAALTALSPSGEEFIPESGISEGNRLRINLTDFFNVAGHYQVKANGNAVDAISMNYDRKESAPELMSADELRAGIGLNNLTYTSVIEDAGKNITEVFSEITTGKKLWKWFLASALLFLLAEGLIVRFWKG